MTNRETMQQALECIERCNAHGWILADYEDEVYASIDALKADLAQPEQEPCIGKDPRCPCQDGDACHYKDCGDTKALPVPVAGTQS